MNECILSWLKILYFKDHFPTRYSFFSSLPIFLKTSLTYAFWFLHFIRIVTPFSILISTSCSTLSVFSVGCQLSYQLFVFSLVLQSKRDTELLDSCSQVVDSLVETVDRKQWSSTKDILMGCMICIKQRFSTELFFKSLG